MIPAYSSGKPWMSSLIVPFNVESAIAENDDNAQYASSEIIVMIFPMYPVISVLWSTVQSYTGRHWRVIANYWDIRLEYRKK